MTKAARLFAVLLTLALHAMVFALATNYQFKFTPKLELEKLRSQVILLEVLPPPPEKTTQEPIKLRPAMRTEPMAPAPMQTPQDNTITTSAEIKKLPTSMAAPPPPTAEEWAFAAKYTNKNSKGYRYSWGQQVRSMMGTVVEGPDQGLVRFRIEIAPNGSLAKLETLWTTSTVAEQLARKAVQNMQPLPPTPTGKPLIFEKTISFTPHASDGPPTYKNDCNPSPPAFRNPFAWDGKSAQVRDDPPQLEKLSPQELEECLRQLPKDSIEAESARDQRLLDQWGSRKSGR